MNWEQSTFPLLSVDFYCWHGKPLYKHKIRIQFCRKSKPFTIIYRTRWIYQNCLQKTSIYGHTDAYTDICSHISISCWLQTLLRCSGITAAILLSDRTWLPSKGRIYSLLILYSYSLSTYVNFSLKKRVTG